VGGRVGEEWEGHRGMEGQSRKGRETKWRGRMKGERKDEEGEGG